MPASRPTAAGAACGSARERAAIETASGVAGCLLGGLVGLVIVFAVVSIWWQSFRMPAAVYIVSTAVVAVIVLPMVLPMSRRLPLFVRWFVVTALLVYLGVLSLCTGMHFSS